MERILLVDDDDDVIEVFVDVLGAEGYELTIARNGREALDLLRSGLRPRAILLDLMMPGMDGFEFRAQQLADPTIADLPVVVLTAGLVTDRVRALRPMATLGKPFNLDDLLDLLTPHPDLVRDGEQAPA
jgi:CheY-like chemotaxis protein